ncbi:hypothetical protein SUGI_0482330 [Cryptomeria japonica]|nr:hypothetical protein SUGI_0482330 [Cryptomeria japonica]
MEVQAVAQYAAFAGDTVVKLSKYVVFKGDNDTYLAAFWTESHKYLQFNTTDIGSGNGGGDGSRIMRKQLTAVIF